LSPCRQLAARDFGATVAARRQIGGGEQFAQAQVAGAILHQQQQARRGRSLLTPSSSPIQTSQPMTGLTPAARRGIELDHAEQVGQVGDRQCRLAVGRRLRDRLIDARQAIGDRIFAVEPEVDEAFSLTKSIGFDISSTFPGTPPWASISPSGKPLTTTMRTSR
jgi:hypothetical protein